MKVRRESQSRLVHASKFRVSSLGQTKVELVGVVSPCVRKQAVSVVEAWNLLLLPLRSAMMHLRNLLAPGTPGMASD
jgi:hypothetical protein